MASALVLSYPTKRKHSSAFLSGADVDSLRHYKRACRVASGFSLSPTTSQFRGLAVDDARANCLDFSLKTNYVPSRSKSLEEVSILSNGSKCPKGNEATVCRTAKGEFPRDGPGWVDCFVREMATVSDMNDAKIRASKLINQYKKHLMVQASPESFKENKVVKDKLEKIQHDNSILKQAVIIKHKRLKDPNAKKQELLVLTEKLKDCEANMKKLEEKNRLLAMRLMVGWENNQ